MDATRDYHSKWSKSQRERQIPYDVIYMWSPKYSTKEPIYKTETDLPKKRTDLWWSKDAGWEKEGTGVQD